MCAGRYLQLLNGLLQPYVDVNPLAVRRWVYFQHDGAPPNPAGEVPNWLDGLGAGEQRNGHQGPRTSRPKIYSPLASSEVTSVQY